MKKDDVLQWEREHCRIDEDQKLEGIIGNSAPPLVKKLTPDTSFVCDLLVPYE